MIVAQWYWLENELFQNCSSMLRKAQLLFISPRSRSEATNLPGVVAIRDSKNPDGPKLLVSAAGWRAFVRGLKSANMPRGFQSQRRCAEGG
jgi:hypothetical protein